MREIAFKIRGWLLRLLAGRGMVMINVKVNGKGETGLWLSSEDVKYCYIKNCAIDRDGIGKGMVETMEEKK